MMVEFVLFLAVAIAPLAAIAVFATGGEEAKRIRIATSTTSWLLLTGPFRCGVR